MRRRVDSQRGEFDSRRLLTHHHRGLLSALRETVRGEPRVVGGSKRLDRGYFTEPRADLTPFTREGVR
jgi:hypothetical protein